MQKETENNRSIGSVFYWFQSQMELHPTPFPVKSQYLKTKPSRNITQASKPNLKGAPPLLRPKRVFGIARNPNLILKSDPQNPKPKPSSKSAKPSQTTQKKKTVCFKENGGDNNGKFVGDESVMELQTPVKVLAKANDSFTPYKSAERCSKCRFDRLETSAYWLGQIKLAESVGKHFVSASFFQLAFDCKAEPFRNIKIGLKKYLVRHAHLNEEEAWRSLSISYGLMKDKAGMTEDTAIVEDQQKVNTEENHSREN